MALTKVTGAGADGLTLSTTDLKIDSGDLVFSTADKGVVLGATSNTDVNTLDDYEEGTWTPVYQPQTGSFTSITHDRQIGRYVKIGKAVYIKGYIRTDAVNVGSSSGAIFIGGLPFTSDSTTYNVSLISGLQATEWAGENPLGGYIDNNLSVIRLFYRSSSTANSNDTVPSDMGTGTNDNGLIFSGWYEV
tara:strand:+ start:73 stop:642 length:570 start_codon:yes stop_codon:yes gene_type:complete